MKDDSFVIPNMDFYVVLLNSDDYKEDINDKKIKSDILSNKTLVFKFEDFDGHRIKEINRATVEFDKYYVIVASKFTNVLFNKFSKSGSQLFNMQVSIIKFNDEERIKEAIFNNDRFDMLTKEMILEENYQYEFNYKEEVMNCFLEKYFMTNKEVKTKKKVISAP